MKTCSLEENANSMGKMCWMTDDALVSLSVQAFDFWGNTQESVFRGHASEITWKAQSSHLNSIRPEDRVTSDSSDGTSWLNRAPLVQWRNREPRPC